MTYLPFLPQTKHRVKLRTFSSSSYLCAVVAAVVFDLAGVGVDVGVVYPPTNTGAWDLELLLVLKRLETYTHQAKQLDVV